VSAAFAIAEREELRVDPLDAFKLRAEARAYLWVAGEYDLHEAVDVLQATAVRDGLVDRIGQDAVQEILAAAFAPAPDDLCVDDEIAAKQCETCGMAPCISPSFCRECRFADSKLLLQQGDPERLRTWLARQSFDEAAELRQRLR
jgi:hypothetical protein